MTEVRPVGSRSARQAADRQIVRGPVARRQHLLGLVRPEFRVEVYAPATDDPALGAAACSVDGCGRPERARGWCGVHHERWAAAGRPDPAAYTRSASDADMPPAKNEVFDMSGLAELLKLEMQYALQCRHDERAGKLRPLLFNPTARRLRDFPDSRLSLLDKPLEYWRLRLHAGKKTPCVFLNFVYDRLGVAYDPRDEFDKDTWDHLRLSAGDGQKINNRYLHFERIPQEWLRPLAKRWIRLYLPTRSPGSVDVKMRALHTFAFWLADNDPCTVDASCLTRDRVESYLAHLQAEPYRYATRKSHIGGLRMFLDDVRLHDWATLPANACVTAADFPKESPQREPRFIEEAVMAQLEDEANLAKLTDDTTRNLLIVVMRTGRRIGEIVDLPFVAFPNGAKVLDHDEAGAPYLRYVAHKMKREHVIPLDPETAAAIRSQQEVVRRAFPAGATLLFAKPTRNPDGVKPFAQDTIRKRFYRWLADCDVRDVDGEPAKIVFHQFRHTIACRMINSGVRMDVVQEFLGHDSPTMTSRYAKIHDRTLKTEFERYRQVRVNNEGVPVRFLPGSVDGDPLWLKEKFKAQALADGYCGLPLNRHCPHPNACLACVHFQTGASFLDLHRRHRDDCQALVEQARQGGNDRWAEMNERTVSQLDKIVGSLDHLAGGGHDAH